MPLSGLRIAHKRRKRQGWVSCGTLRESGSRGFQRLQRSIAFIRVNIPVGKLPVFLPEGVTVGCMVVAPVVRVRTLSLFNRWQFGKRRRRDGRPAGKEAVAVI